MQVLPSTPSNESTKMTVKVRRIDRMFSRIFFPGHISLFTALLSSFINVLISFSILILMMVILSMDAKTELVEVLQLQYTERPILVLVSNPVVFAWGVERRLRRSLIFRVSASLIAVVAFVSTLSVLLHWPVAAVTGGVVFASTTFLMGFLAMHAALSQ